ncbi:MAG: 30S ribosomal protein S27e [archaeon]
MSSFIEITCPDCNQKQVVFSHPSRNVVCLVCGKLLVKPTGGKGKFLVDKKKMREVL